MQNEAPIPQGVAVYDRPESSFLSPAMLIGGLVVIGSAVAALVHYL
jgi:hypothetical protein